MKSRFSKDFRTSTEAKSTSYHSSTTVKAQSVSFIKTVPKESKADLRTAKEHPKSPSNCQKFKLPSSGELRDRKMDPLVYTNYKNLPQNSITKQTANMRFSLGTVNEKLASGSKVDGKGYQLFPKGNPSKPI